MDMIITKGVKPCPFCGEQVEIRCSDKFLLSMYYVCHPENSRCVIKRLIDIPQADSFKEAIEIWNQRADGRTNANEE